MDVIMRVSRLGIASVLALFILGGFVAGCTAGKQTTVEYNAKKNQTAYKTRPYPVSKTSGGNYGDDASVNAQILAYCQGPNCTPEMTHLVFTTDVGNSDQFTITSTSGRIVADGEEIRWSSTEANKQMDPNADESPNLFNTVRGRFATIDLTMRQLKQIASASDVQGSIGGVSLYFSSSLRSAAQKLLQEMRNETSRATSARSGT